MWNTSNSKDTQVGLNFISEFAAMQTVHSTGASTLSNKKN
jgi:hypothetical protein